ncbi:MAG: hypothetical protein JRJ38_14245 [Deltaproteobacteria bacterium]|nr:hypothetical protein [Deltaproteobacteria bacterium]
MEEFELVLGRDIVFTPTGLTPPQPTIDATQRRINELMGVSDEDILKYACKAPGPDSAAIPDEDRRKINQMMGVSDEDFLKYACKAPGPDSAAIPDEGRRKINELMGVTDEDILKYS